MDIRGQDSFRSVSNWEVCIIHDANLGVSLRECIMNTDELLLFWPSNGVSVSTQVGKIEKASIVKTKLGISKKH